MSQSSTPRVPLHLAALAGLTLLAPVCSGRAAPAPSPEAPAGLLYVANQDPATVNVIDTEQGRVVHTVNLQALGFSGNAKPHHTAVEPDGSYWYVSLIGDGKVLKFDRENRLVGQADFETPGMLALHPTRDLLFVGRSMAAVNPPQRIGVIERSDMSIEEVDVFFPRPHAIAVDPRGDYVYTASLGVNQVAALRIDDEDLTLVDLEGAQHAIVQFTVSPDGTRLMGSGQLTGKALIFDSSDPSNLHMIRTIDVAAWPWHPAYTPDGRWIYVGNQRANRVTVIDAQRWEVASVIEGPGLAEPHGIAVSSDGSTVYVSNHNLEGSYHSTDPNRTSPVGTVVAIDTETRRIVDVIEVDVYAAGMSLAGGR